MKTLCLIFTIGLLGANQTAHASVSSSQNAVPASGDAAILKASQAIRKSHLVDQPEDCYAYKIISQTRQYYEVEVEEAHNHRECPGDKEALPRLFSVRVSRTNGSFTSDAKTPGKFHKI